MKHILFMMGIIALLASGCDSPDVANAQVIMASRMSQQIALSNAKAHLSRAYQNKYTGLSCQADDDIEENNLNGDGDADCQFVSVSDKKKIRLECSTIAGKGCKKQ